MSKRARVSDPLLMAQLSLLVSRVVRCHNAGKRIQLFVIYLFTCLSDVSPFAGVRPKKGVTVTGFICSPSQQTPGPFCASMTHLSNQRQSGLLVDKRIANVFSKDIFENDKHVYQRLATHFYANGMCIYIVLLPVINRENQ